MNKKKKKSEEEEKINKALRSENESHFRMVLFYYQLNVNTYVYTKTYSEKNWLSFIKMVAISFENP